LSKPKLTKSCRAEEEEEERIIERITRIEDNRGCEEHNDVRSIMMFWWLMTLAY